MGNTPRNPRIVAHRSHRSGRISGRDCPQTKGKCVKTLVIIPTYNESENVEWITKAILENQPQVNILIADDNSPDGTGDIADSLAENDARIFVLHRAGKEGLGAAYRVGPGTRLRRPRRNGC